MRAATSVGCGEVRIAAQAASIAAGMVTVVASASAHPGMSPQFAAMSRGEQLLPIAGVHAEAGAARGWARVAGALSDANGRCDLPDVMPAMYVAIRKYRHGTMTIAHQWMIVTP